jgi:hypothetical protein
VWNLSAIVRAGRRGSRAAVVDVKLPPYLLRQQAEVSLVSEEVTLITIT